MNFKDKWLQAVDKKNSLLCVGIDPAEPSQRSKSCLPEGISKLDFCLKIIEDVAPYSAAIKPNRQYLRDFSRSQFQTLNEAIHHHGMVSIDDSKIADIGDTNDSAFYHSKEEGYDAITYAPFPGNIKQAIQHAQNRDLGIITLVLMSNPEYLNIKNSQISGTRGFEWVASQVKSVAGDGVVIGAPSETNHLNAEEIQRTHEILGETLVLVPGIGAQGGSLGPIVNLFKSLTIANVGRAIMYAPDPAEAAKSYHKMIQDLR